MLVPGQEVMVWPRRIALGLPDQILIREQEQEQETKQDVAALLGV